MKKSLIIILLILSLSGCLKTEDIIPEEDYGAWDGNYIYYDNYRSKTTGEDEEPLFETIKYDNLEYQIESFCDIKFYNNHIYYLVNGFNPGNNELNYFIIIYSFDIKEIKYYKIFEDLEYSSYFLTIDDNYIIISIDDNSSLVYDLNTRNQMVIDGSQLDEFGCYKIKDSFVQFASWNDLTFQKLIEIPFGYSCRCDIIKIANRNLIHIQIRSNDTSNNYDANLCFYDLDNNVLYNLVPVEENKYIDYYEKYYIVGTLNEYKYTNKNGDQLSEKLVTGCQLFELNFEENKITSNKIFNFEEDIQYQINELDHKDILRLKTTEIKKGNALFSGKIKKDEAYFNTKNNMLKWFYLPINKNEQVRTNMIICIQFEYYSETKHYGGILSDKVAVYVYRYNKETDETKLMQFYLNYESEQKETICRYSKNLIRDDYYTFLNKCLILDK